MTTSKKYISQVKKHLKCSLRAKKKILKVFTPEIYSFGLSNSTAQYSDYLKEFGDPELTAAEYLCELSNKEKRAYWVSRLTAAVLAIVIAFSFMIMLFIQQRDGVGYVIASSVVESKSEKIIHN